MAEKVRELSVAARELSTDELRELIAALARLVEGRAAEADPPPSSNRVVVEQRRTRSATLQLELVKCGKPRCGVCKRAPAHGPYWYAYWKRDGRTRTKYLGKTLPESFTDYVKDTEGGGYTPQALSVPRSYVTLRKGKSKRLHKTIKRRAKAGRRRFANPLFQKTYDNLRAHPITNVEELEKVRRANAAMGAYVIGFTLPDEPPGLAKRGTQAYAAWAAGVDNAKSSELKNDKQ